MKTMKFYGKCAWKMQFNVGIVAYPIDQQLNYASLFEFPSFDDSHGHSNFNSFYGYSVFCRYNPHLDPE
jgi:hypothetical protein